MPARGSGPHCVGEALADAVCADAGAGGCWRGVLSCKPDSVAAALLSAFDVATPAGLVLGQWPLV